VLSRRSLLVTGLAGGLTGCASRTKNAYVGFAFVATRDSGDIAIVDLAAFSLEKKRIKPSGRPVQLIDVPGQDFLLSVSDNGAVEEVSVTETSITRKLKSPLAPESVWLNHDATTIWGLSPDHKTLLAVDRATFNTRAQWTLPARARTIAVSPGSPHVAVSFEGANDIGILRDSSEKEFLISKIDQTPGQLRYLKNGSMLIVTHDQERQLTMVDSASGKIVVALPLPIRPENLCFNSDGGQLFITGEGLDGVVVVYPYQSQVAATLLSGKSPGPMAVSRQPQYLFVTSPSTDTVSVLDVRTQKLAAVIAVGNNPRCIVFTPDSQMALVLNQRSGDMAIIRLGNIVSKRQKTAPLFTMIPVGSAPVAAVVRSVSV
jgi:YVTN family beta-propeller protein